MDIKTPEQTNGSEQIETIAVPLSPIVEMDESSLTDSELLESQSELIATMSIEKTDKLSCQEPTKLDLERSGTGENGGEDCEARQCSIQLPETPPEVLWKQLKKFQNYSKYLETEYKELVEFTKLEKQIEHEDCVSKEMETSLKNELELLNEKVKYLIQDNEDLQTKILSKETEIKMVKMSLSSCQEVQSLTEQSINNFGVKLSTFLTGSVQEVLENNPSLHTLFENTAESRHEKYSVEDIHVLIDSFLNYHNETRSKVEELCVKNEELKSTNEVHIHKIKDLENSLICLEHEKSSLASELLTEFSTKTDLLNSLSEAKTQCEEVEGLLRRSCVKNSKLEKELCNVFKVNDIQVEFQSVIKELDSLLISWDTSKDLNYFVDTLLKNKQLITCVNIVMDHESQMNLVSLLNKLRERLKCYDNERFVLNKTVLELKKHIQVLENETSDIKSSVSLLNCEVQDMISIRIKELEVKFDLVVHEKLDLQSKIDEMRNKNKDLSEALLDANSQLEERNKRVEVDKHNDCKIREIGHCLNCSNSHSLQKEPTEVNYLKEKLKELEKLKEMMAFEIIGLDGEENNSSILSLSSDEIFARFMENIIKKEEEITTSIQKRFKVDLKTAQEKAENSKNKRKSQESWIIVLQSENEAMSKELTCIKDKNLSLEEELKNVSINLNSANAEIYNMKIKILELKTENDMLGVNNEKLINLFKIEKESVLYLQNCLRKLKEDITTKEHIMQDLNPSMGILESTEKEYYNVNKESFTKQNPFVDNNTNYSYKKHEDDLNLSTIISCSDEQSNLCERIAFLKEECNQIDNLSKPSLDNNTFVKNLENEKVLLVELLDQSETDEHLGEHLLSCTENFTIIKDILQSFAKKIIEIEGTKSSKLLLMETEFSNITELCNDIKSDIAKLYDDVVSDNLTQENENYNCCQSSQMISSYSYMMSVKEELELVKEGCSQISSHSNNIGKSAENGKYILDVLRREVNKIKQGSIEKDVVINDLKNTVSNGQSEIKEQEKEIGNCLSKINTLVEEKTLHQNEVKELTDQISRLGNIIFECDINVPITKSNVSSLIDCFRQELKQSVQNKCLLTDLTESIQFFTSQLSLLLSYVKDLEIKHLSTQKNNASLAKEVDVLKEHLTRAKIHIVEADTFLNRVISNIPYKISSIHEAMEAAEQIFSEYKTLKETERLVCSEQKVNQDKLAQQHKDIKFLEKYNSDLKVQLDSYENDIRGLRFELRNLRSEWRRKERSRGSIIEQESQTEQLCCREFQDQVLNLKELANARSLKIVSLELQMKDKDLSYMKKVSELQCALLQAKERVRDLRIELTENKNITKDIIESYNAKYEKSELKSSEESVLRSSHQKKTNYSTN